MRTTIRAGLLVQNQPKGGQMKTTVRAGLLVQKSGSQTETWSSKPSRPNSVFMAQFYPCTQVSSKIALKYHSLQSRRPLKDALLSTCLIMQPISSLFSLSFMVTILSGYFPPLIHSGLLSLNNSSSVFNSDSPITVERIAAMVRLGRKYELSTLYEEAMRRLKSDFPRDLTAWRKACLQKDRNFMSKKKNLIEIINLAVEQNLQSLLPAAMLALCRSITLVSRFSLLVSVGVASSRYVIYQNLPNSRNLFYSASNSRTTQGYNYCPRQCICVSWGAPNSPLLSSIGSHCLSARTFLPSRVTPRSGVLRHSPRFWCALSDGLQIPQVKLSFPMIGKTFWSTAMMRNLMIQTFVPVAQDPLSQTLPAPRPISGCSCQDTSISRNGITCKCSLI